MNASFNEWNGTSVVFRDRRSAGLQLANELRRQVYSQPIVLALPRGGVPVAYEVARALDAPLDVWIVRKVGVPWHPELGVGAVAEGGYLYLSKDMSSSLGLSEEDLRGTIRKERAEVERRVKAFRGDHPAPKLSGCTVFLIDDGIATGGTMRAAIRSIRAEKPKRIVLAVPVAPPDTIEELAPEVDEVVCLITPASMSAIGFWYEDFRQVSSEDVVELLERRRREMARNSRKGAEHATR